MESAQQDTGSVQLGVNANEAKVFKAHAAPLGLCDTLVNALKLLANQQKDGDSPIQSIVTSLPDRRAVDVGHLRKGMKPFTVQKPNFSEDYPEAAIREGADEFTLRVDEVGTQRTLVNTEHVEFERWGTRTGKLSAKQFTKEWEELYCHCREMRKATGAKKPSESQKANAFGQ